MNSVILKSCRLCQNSLGEVFIDENLGRTILNITKIQVNNELYSSMPQSICLLCLNILKDTQIFIDMVQKENENLKKIITVKHNAEALAKVYPNIESDSSNIEKQLKDSEREVQTSTVHPRRKCTLRCYPKHKKGDQKLFCQTCDVLFEDTLIKQTHQCKKNFQQFVESKNSTKRDLKKETDIPGNKFTKHDGCDQNFGLENKDNSSKCNSPDDEMVLDENYLNDFIPTHLLETEKLDCKKGNIERKRPFLCVTCGKDFSTKNSLTCHEKIHSAVKGYKCDPCQVEFSVRSNLRAHIRKYHEGVRFYCSQCTKEFLTKCSLDRHEKIHTGIKEFKCKHCSSAFYTNKELVKHQRYHQGLKQHKCEECFKTFFERHHLIIHLRSHSGERPYVCNITGCGKSFVESQKLKRHHKAKHTIK
ncbi:regulator of cullins 2 isoform X1 [Leptinotarsa decemlineata]|uniref:regulator of cullins 2 isoform X1 n=2 Tax=Leptinotarsa decemlineata TaxID=7539 RepID=UPI003D305B48